MCLELSRAEGLGRSLRGGVRKRESSPPPFPSQSSANPGSFLSVLLLVRKLLAVPEFMLMR